MPVSVAAPSFDNTVAHPTDPGAARPPERWRRAWAAMYDPVIQRIRDMGNPGLIMSGSREEGVLWSGVRGEPMPSGRGQFISRRHGVRLVQTAIGDRSSRQMTDAG